MLNAQHLINDGLNGACQNNGGTTWTYNQGVILGGIAELLTIARDPYWQGVALTVDPTIATNIADAAISTLIDANGILREPCEPTPQGCGQDAPQFKGIFMRNLARFTQTLHLQGLAPASVARYQQFAFKNATSIWSHDRILAPHNTFGLHWSGPVDTTDAARQTSALDAFNAALLLSTL